jgi:hypothetical protein
MRIGRIGVWLVAPLHLNARPAAAEWQVKPFAALTFGGGTTFVDLEMAAPRPHRMIGVTGVLIGEVFGLDVDLGRASGFFHRRDQNLLLGSGITTLTGDLIVAMPHRMTEYTLRPYFVAGLGMVRVRIDGRFGALRVASTRPTMDFGGGVTGFLTKRVGLSWEVRRFSSLGDNQLQGASFGGEHLSFWRANMAVAIRY